MSKLYDILNLTKDASSSEIKKSYYNLAKIHHPDRGGDPEIFKKISHSYEILSDEQKRSQYDQLGDDNFENTQKGGGPPPMNPFDLFSQMFGGMNIHNPFQHQRKTSRKLADKLFTINISLKEAFYGITKNFRISVEKPCSQCQSTCKTCNGSGNISKSSQNGFMIQVFSQQCPQCQGKGISLQKGNSCLICQGNSQFFEEKELQMNIPSGVKTGYYQKFIGLGDQASLENEISGDLIFEIKIDSHPYFQRTENNLLYKKSISLKESIIGCQVLIIGIDDENIVFDTNQLPIIKENYKHSISGKGMKIEGKDIRGDLIIEFNIIYPSKILSQEERNNFEKICYIFE